MAEPRAVFVFNLLQDVNVLRGLVFLVRRETAARPVLLVSQNFVDRDLQKIWQAELARLAQEVSAELILFASPQEAFAALQGWHGVIVAGSESDLNAHRDTRDLFRLAPPGWITVTLQHGFECVGFRQSREHGIAHGRNIRFNADVVCGWYAAPALSSLSWGQRGKLQVTGPPTLLQRVGDSLPEGQAGTGLVCENLHSVRLRATGDHAASFMETFEAFCAAEAAESRRVTLRPHPGGQYVLKNNVPLPDNVGLSTAPMYRVDLTGFAYGISAPSTVVFDMVLAGIPTAVWRDGGGLMDAGNYGGLTEISSVDEWIAFAREAREAPDAILARQAAFLDRLQMPLDPAEIYRRFTRILRNALAAAPAPDLPPARTPVRMPSPAAGPDAPLRLLYIANQDLPTLQICLKKPLELDCAAGRIETELLTEKMLTDRFKADRRSVAAADWFLEQIEAFRPDVVLCCRYTGPHPNRIIRHCRAQGVPLVYHIDDDLLRVPRELGEAKHAYHNDPKRLTSLQTLLTGADLVYCSNERLRQRLVASLPGLRRVRAGAVNAASRVLAPAERRPVRRIGYMGFDHAHDFEVASGAVAAVMRRHPEIEFELIAPFALPDELVALGDRVRRLDPIRDYGAFMAELARRRWDIGICPLAYTAFNLTKSNNKWIEYTATGAAVVASRGLIYDDCAGSGRGLLVAPQEWEAALSLLIEDPELRYRMVLAAQAELQITYSEARLRAQVLEVLSEARDLASQDALRPLAELRRPVVLDGTGALVPAPTA